MAAYDITTNGSSLEFDTQNYVQAMNVMMDDNHCVLCWAGPSSHAFAQAFTINTSTWAVTTANSSLEFDTQGGNVNNCIKIDSTHILNIWNYSGSGSYAQVLAVNTSTWAVTTAGASFNISTYNSSNGMGLGLMDANHAIVAFNGADEDGYIQVLEINTTTWAITAPGTALEFDTTTYNSSGNAGQIYKIDATHCIMFWYGGAGTGWTQVFTVNTSTWAVTTSASSLNFDTYYYATGANYAIDSNHFLNFWIGGADYYTRGVVFIVNTSTWAVTTATSIYDINTTAWNNYRSTVKVDGNHFITFWSEGTTDDGFVQVYTVNTSTWAISTTVNALEFDTQNGTYDRALQIDTNHYINFWNGVDGDGFVQTFTLASAVVGPANVKTYKGLAAASVKTCKGLAVASIKTKKGLN